MKKPIYSLIGHKSRCFDIKTLNFHNTLYLLSSSEDGTAILWRPKESKKPQFIFNHGMSVEVLRSCFIFDSINRICTCGADGKAIIWVLQSTDSISNDQIEEKIKNPTILNYIKFHAFDHNEEQIYACESILNKCLFTIAESMMTLWNIEDTNQLPKIWNFEIDGCLFANPNTDSDNSLQSLYTHHNFTYEENSEITTFGGVRNPEGKVYLFDAKVYSHDQSKVAVATSECMIYIVSLEHEVANSSCKPKTPKRISLEQKDIERSHITSVCWHDEGRILLAALGSGHAVIVDTELGNILTRIMAHSQVCYGLCFVPDRSNVDSDIASSSDTKKIFEFITWSSDTFIRRWLGTSSICNVISSSLLSSSSETIDTKNSDVNRDVLTCQIIEEFFVSKYPVYGCEICESENWIIFSGGDSSKPTFMGIPIYIATLN